MPLYCSIGLKAFVQKGKENVGKCFRYCGLGGIDSDWGLSSLEPKCTFCYRNVCVQGRVPLTYGVATTC